MQHQLEFGGEVSGRSIVKSALAMAHYSEVPISACGDAILYLRDSAASACFGYYQDVDPIKDRPMGVPFHCAAVDANPVSGLVLGYLEYFGIYRVVVCLGRNYHGRRIKSGYAIDPRNGELLDISVDLEMDATEIEAIFRYERVSAESIQRAFGHVISPALISNFQTEKRRVFDEAMDYAWKNCGGKPDEPLTEEQIKKFSFLVAQRLTPFISFCLK